MIAGLYKAFQHWSARGTVWIYSDPHFGDKHLAEGQVNRPDDETQIKNINSKVGKHDTLIILGDIGDIECARKLKGYKILICGNHDVGHTVYEEVFDEVYQGALIIGEKLILSHEPIQGISWAMNLHGHDHSPTAKNDMNHFNFCAEHIGFMPVNFNQWMKQGHLSKIQTIHRATIDKATVRARKRGKRAKN